MQATPAQAAIDEALAGHGLRDFFRGFADSRRYASLRQVGADWLAGPRDGSEAIIVGEVNPDYLAGLESGGCAVSAERSGMRAAA